MTAFVLTAALMVAAPVPKDAEFDRGVANARQRAIDFLKKQQNKDGLWEGRTLEFLSGMDGGPTALVTLSLLEAGVSSDDAAVKKALEYLVKLEPKKTYVVSLQIQVLARAGAKKYAKEIQATTDWLLKNGAKKGDKVIGWSYPANDMSDGSNTHFAVMALHAAAQAGAKIDDAVWGQVRDHYVATRRRDGWTYVTGQPGQPATGSMTLCGTLGLAIAAKHDKNPKALEAEIDKGTAASIELRAPSDKSEGYRLFTIAELGRTLGSNEFKSGEKGWAWYREGAERLVKMQMEDGSWEFGKGIDGNATLSTAFGLYFLGKPAKP